MDQNTVLAELLEVSPQVVAVVVADRTGSPVASAFRNGSNDEAVATRLGTLSQRILDEAEQSRVALGREPVVQCEIATGDGNVFMVTDERHVVLAVTETSPTVGLVLYDLKTALRSLREPAAAAGASTTKKGDA